MLKRHFTGLVLGLCLLLSAAGGALAHAGLITTDPADGSVLADAPAAIIFTYTEPVSPIGFSLIGVGGAPAALGDIKIEGPAVTVALPDGLAKGSYLVSWRVTSEDGHPVNGTVSFAVGAASGPVAAPQTDIALGAAIWLVRAAQYVALFFGVGGLAFGLVAPLPRRARGISRGLSIAGLVLVPAAIGLQGLDLLGLDLPALATVAPWSAALVSTYAQTEGLLALAFLLAVMPGRAAAGIAAALGALAPTLSGHASTAAPEALMRGVVFVHVASLMFWLGALLPLGLSLRDDGAVLRRFSRIIPVPIATLLASGVVLALMQLGPPEPDWLSSYGVLLAIKLVLVIGLLVLALWNRVRLTVRAQSGDFLPLRRSIGLELGLVVIILGVVSGWRFTPPPRVLAEIAAASAPITTILKADNTQADLTVTPGRVGPVSIATKLPVAARSVTLQVSNPAAGIATISRPATQAADGSWRVDGLVLPAGGAWDVLLLARTGEFDLTTLKGSFALPATETTMKLPTVAAAAMSSALLAAPAVADDAFLASCPTGQTFSAGGITISGAYSRATLKGAPTAAGYLAIHNAGPAADTFTGVTSPAASDVTLHQMTMNGQVMEMSDVPDGVTVPPGGDVSFDPMGYHLMLTGLAGPLVQGQCVPMVLHFARAGDISVQFNIGGIAQDRPVTDNASSSAPMDMGSMEMSGMSSMPGM